MWEKLRVKRVEEKLLIPSDCLRKSERSRKRFTEKFSIWSDVWRVGFVLQILIFFTEALESFSFCFEDGKGFLVLEQNKILHFEVSWLLFLFCLNGKLNKFLFVVPQRSIAM